MYLPFYFYLHMEKLTRQNTIDERCHGSKGNVCIILLLIYTTFQIM